MVVMWSHKGSKLLCPWCHTDCDILMEGRGGKVLRCTACNKRWPNTCRSTYANRGDEF